MPLFNLGHATHDRVGAEDLGEQGEQIGLACLVAPAFLNYLSGHRSKERKREENEKDEAMCPRKSSRNWAVSPERQPLIFTIHKHRELCSARQISQCRQHLSVCGLKDCSSPPQEVQILMAIYNREVYWEWNSKYNKHILHCALQSLPLLSDFACSGLFRGYSLEFRIIVWETERRWSQDVNKESEHLPPSLTNAQSQIHISITLLALCVEVFVCHSGDMIIQIHWCCPEGPWVFSLSINSPLTPHT